MTDRPIVGDAFGEILRAALAEQSGDKPPPTIGPRMPRPVVEIVERDDGFIVGNPAARYLAGPDDWWPCERRAVDSIEGSTLDIGAGAGRIALTLQERGIAVTALDVSAGAVEVARARGVHDNVCSTVNDHARSGRRYDTFALFGNNLGLLGSPDQASTFLATLASMARPGARIVAQTTDPYSTADQAQLDYQARNRARGNPGGLYRQRVRYQNLTTPFIDYLLCSAGELAELVSGSGWRLAEVDDENAPVYVAILVLGG